MADGSQQVAQPRTETVTASRLEELANTSDTTVYGYTYRVPEATLDAGTQITLYKQIVDLFDAACVEAPDLCDEGLREAVLASSDQVQLFQRLYPKVFASSTYRALNPVMEERLDKTRKISMYMLAERLHGDGDDDERAARAMCAGMRIAMRETTEEDLKDGVQLAAGPSQTPSEAEAAAALSVMTPLDRREFGDSTVKQGRTF